MKDKQLEDKSKFFCSELVTAFYKHIGILQSYVKSYTYMPGDFAEREAGSRLNLVGAILEPEVMVTKWSTWSRARMIIEDQRRKSISQYTCFTPKYLDRRNKKKELFSKFLQPFHEKSAVHK